MAKDTQPLGLYGFPSLQRAPSLLKIDSGSKLLLWTDSPVDLRNWDSRAREGCQCQRGCIEGPPVRGGE